MSETYSTGLIEIRDFLRERRCVPAPWSAPRDVVDGLYAALTEKRADAVFWGDMKVLLRQLNDRRVNTAALRNLEVLSDGALDKIADDLRASLNGGNGQGRSALRRWVSQPVGIAALLGFLVLGTAVGCDEGGNGSGACPAAKEDNVPSDEAAVYCQLVSLIRSADIAQWDRDALLDCLPELDGAYRENLLAQFNEMTDEQLADALEDLVYADVCANTGDDDTDSAGH
jgi:hypothetical protein